MHTIGPPQLIGRISVQHPWEMQSLTYYIGSYCLRMWAVSFAFITHLTHDLIQWFNLLSRMWRNPTNHIKEKQDWIGLDKTKNRQSSIRFDDMRSSWSSSRKGVTNKLDIYIYIFIFIFYFSFALMEMISNR